MHSPSDITFLGGMMLFVERARVGHSRTHYLFYYFGFGGKSRGGAMGVFFAYVVLW